MPTITPEQKVEAGWSALDWLTQHGHIEAMWGSTTHRIYEVDANGDVWLTIGTADKDGDELPHSDLKAGSGSHRYNADELIAQRTEQKVSLDAASC